MPEGDAVRRTARRLDQALAGGILERAELRVPRFATVELSGATVLGTATAGKHMLTRMTHHDRELTLHHHLRMDGAWRIGRPGPPRAPAHLIRVWLASAEQQALGIRLHDVAVDLTEREQQWIGHLGPDILAEGFEPDRAVTRLAASGLPLVEALLDQRLICGLGTMWASEAAHTARASPRSAPAQAEGLAEALAAIRRRMLAAVDEAPMSSRRALRVFERTGQPCRTCGTPIRAGRVGTAPMQRPTYWCPTCQA